MRWWGHRQGLSSGPAARPRSPVGAGLLPLQYAAQASPAVVAALRGAHPAAAEVQDENEASAEVTALLSALGDL